MSVEPSLAPKHPDARWRFMERFDIVDVSNMTDVYLRRWTFVRTPWFGVMLHHILRPDGDRALHDHPWSFVSFVLRGGYTEELPIGTAHNGMHLVSRSRRMPGRWHRLTAEGMHRIDALHGDCWTLVLTGPKRRTWGFSERPGHWVDWRTYLDVTS